MCFFVPSVGPCVHHNYGVISGRRACKDCVWPISLVVGLCTTCRSEQVLVAIRFNATFLPLRPYCEKMCRLPVSWTMQKVQECLVARCDAVRFLYSSFFEHYNYILLCDWVPGPYSVILRTCAGHNAFVHYLGSAWVGLYFLTCDFPVLIWMYCCTKCYKLANNYVNKMFVM